MENDKSCRNNEEKDGINENTRLFFSFQTTFPKMDSQSPEKTILYDENNKIYDLVIQGSIFKNFFLLTLKWIVIKYIEKKDIEKKDYQE